jgi:rubredoxin
MTNWKITKITTGVATEEEVKGWEEIENDDICPVCGSKMIDDEEEQLLQHTECPICGYFENIYGNAIDFYGKECFEEKKKEIGLLNE